MLVVVVCDVVSMVGAQVFCQTNDNCRIENEKINGIWVRTKKKWNPETQFKFSIYGTHNFSVSIVHNHCHYHRHIVHHTWNWIDRIFAMQQQQQQSFLLKMYIIMHCYKMLHTYTQVQRGRGRREGRSTRLCKHEWIFLYIPLQNIKL